MSGAALILGLHLATAHFGAPAGGPDLTDRNPGAYVRLGNGATAGAFRNSHRRSSVYAGWTWQTRDGRWALTVGAVTGYPRAAVAPLLVPSVRLPLAAGSPWAARLSYLHKPHSDGASGVHLSIERSW